MFSAATELGKLIGQGLSQANQYKDDFIETEEVTDIDLYGIESINVTGSYIVSSVVYSSDFTVNHPVYGIVSGGYDTYNSYFYWPFKDGSYADIIQGSTLTGSAISSSGISGSGMRFLGSQDLTLPSSGTGSLLDFDYNDSFSISCWINPSELSTSSGYTKSIMGKLRQWGLDLNYVTSSTGRFRFGVRFGGGSTSYIANSDGSGGYGLLSTSGLNQWYHLVGIHNAATSSVHLAVNTLISSTAVTSTWNAANINFQMGLGGTISGNEQRFKGYIDDARIYNYALSSSEISYLYNNRGREVIEYSPVGAGTILGSVIVSSGIL